MAYKPKTAEQIFLSNVLIRLVENHLLRRKVRAVIRDKTNPLHPLLVNSGTLENLDNRIDLLARAYDNHSGGSTNV